MSINYAQKDTLRHCKELIKAGIHIDRSKEDVFISRIENDNGKVLVIFALIPDENLLTISVTEQIMYKRENERVLFDAVKQVTQDSSFDELHIELTDGSQVPLLRKTIPLRHDLSMEHIGYALEETYRSYSACMDEYFGWDFAETTM